jgi:transcriptional regulator with XRE-family HTH domain
LPVGRTGAISRVSPAAFGRQVKKERLAQGWSLRELSARSDIDFSHLSRIESGKRPPTEAIADALDAAFPRRNGWFREYYEDNKSAIPPGLRSWAEHEDRAARLSVWCPGTVHGLFQTEAYARVFLSTLPSVPGEVIATRLANRMARQHRVLFREDPPSVSCIVDHVALYRGVGSPETMAAQMRHLLEVASLPNVTMQVLPAVAHPATASELIIADNNAAYAEHLAAGGVYIESETFTRLELVFTTIRAECYRASDSAAIIRKAENLWTGASRRSAARTDRA